jgi:hypothetical protein
METYKVITLDETRRISVLWDSYAGSPTEWNWNVGLYPINQSRGYDGWRMDFGFVNDELDSLVRSVEYQDVDVDEAIHKHLARAGLKSRTVTLRGNSQSEWWTAIVYGEDNEFDGFLNTMTDYLTGQVFVVRLEKLHTYADVDNADSTHTHWEYVDSIGEVYRDGTDEDAQFMDVLGIEKVSH